ncbi:MAG: hypothetical protein Q8R10_13385 [Pseudomonas sp.]|uniref:hypothetical protein n=1 Tax=Pseudomonas sp. TaxID=306 RepID=UPI002734E379|nr:hypothetical protein [Pseudomonas sp.]MDP3847403.1 hypothetical protein [Pseudomonas sp.]
MVKHPGQIQVASITTSWASAYRHTALINSGPAFDGARPVNCGGVYTNRGIYVTEVFAVAVTGFVAASIGVPTTARRGAWRLGTGVTYALEQSADLNLSWDLVWMGDLPVEQRKSVSGAVFPASTAMPGFTPLPAT